MSTSIQGSYRIGIEPDIHFIPYLIFISYIVSSIGAFTTVELLHRRVSGQGWRNWIQLAACSVSFGLVAIWCMHFVGNRAIVLGNGEAEIQLYYNATYTAVSAILPIVVIFLGLIIADRFYKGNKHYLIRYAALFTCGICTGAAVTEMHYLGNQGTTNYRLKPKWRYIVGAAAIAVGACLISFSLFFRWSRHWVNNIWRRLVVTFFLAGAVSGLHWTAAAGTSYQLTGYHTGSGDMRNTNLIIALCLCLGACGVCFAMGFIKQVQNKKVKDRAEQVVLALATFDDNWNLLVTQSGLLPCQTITRQFHQRTFDEDFNNRHPVFQWLFRVSRNWGGVVDLLPAMRDHLHYTGFLQSSTPILGNTSRTSIDNNDHTNYSATFRELFCITAQDIARSMGSRLQDLGCLYERVETTGTLATRVFFKSAHGTSTINADVAVTQGTGEARLANPILFGRGQLLVLTRKVGIDEASRLQNIGFRFASLDQIGNQLAHSLQIPRDDLNGLVLRLQSYCERRSTIPTQGVHLAAFLLKPLPVLKGLDVIVPTQTPDRLPMVQLSSEALTHEQVQLLSTFDGHTLLECLEQLASIQKSEIKHDPLLILFRNKIHELLCEVPETALRHAVFSAQQLPIAHGTTGRAEPYQATVMAFCGIKEVYHQSLHSLKLQCIPFSFFETIMRSLPGSPDHAILAQENHKEFTALLSFVSENAPENTRRGSLWSTWFGQRPLPATSDTAMDADSRSERGLVNTSASFQDNVGHAFGGIMVSQDVVIRQDGKISDQFEMQDLGFKSEAGVADTEQLTMAGRLMAITTAFRDPHARPLMRETSGKK